MRRVGLGNAWYPTAVALGRRAADGEVPCDELRGPSAYLDHRADSGYLESVCRAVESYPEVDILCGRILPDWDGSEPDWVHDDGPYRIYPLPVPRYDLGERPLASPHETATPGGGNLVLRTTLFDRVGDFSTVYGPVGRGLGGAEDHEWVLRAIAAGARVQYVPEIVQYHYVDPARLKLTYLVRKAYERSASAVRLGGTGNGGGLVPAYMFRKTAVYWLAERIRPRPGAHPDLR